MADAFGKGSSVPSKIMAGLAVTVVLGLGLCGVSAATSAHSEKVTEVFLIVGTFCFWGGLLLLILFAVGWVIVAIGKGLFGKKD